MWQRTDTNSERGGIVLHQCHHSNDVVCACINLCVMRESNKRPSARRGYGDAHECVAVLTTTNRSLSGCVPMTLDCSSAASLCMQNTRGAQQAHGRLSDLEPSTCESVGVPWHTPTARTSKGPSARNRQISSSALYGPCAYLQTHAFTVSDSAVSE